MKNIIYSLVIMTFIGFIATGCSGKKQLEKGNYLEAVYKSVEKLRKSPDNKKAMSTLRQAYPLAVNYYKDLIETSLQSTDVFKWNRVVGYMNSVNSMADEIARCPSAKKIVPSPFKYVAELNKALTNAAEENYKVGNDELAKNTRESAKEAYFLFVKANELVYGYKDVETLISKAKELATLRVVLEQIPVGAGRLEISAQFFQNNVEAFIENMFKSRLFLELYLPKEAEKMKLIPHQIIRIQFDDFVVGNTVFSQRTSTVTSKDSVKVGEYKKSDGSSVPVLNRVSAELTTYKKEVISKGLVDVKIIDYASKKMLMQDKMPGEYVWVCQWASYNGDERALSAADKSLCKQREIQPPAPQDLFVEFTKPIYDQVTSRLSNFYSSY